MTTGTRLVLVIVGLAVAVAVSRIACVPVGSFREGLEGLEWGMSAETIESTLGLPNRVCTQPRVDHLILDESELDRVAESLLAHTAERWVYSRRRPAGRPVPDPSPTCQAPPAGTELGFDGEGRLRWKVREQFQTPVEFDPELEPLPER